MVWRGCVQSRGSSGSGWPSPPPAAPPSFTSQNQARKSLSDQEGVGDPSLIAPALRLVSCSQGPNCRHFPSEVSGHFQKQFQENMQLLLPILLFLPQG